MNPSNPSTDSRFRYSRPSVLLLAACLSIACLPGGCGNETQSAKQNQSPAGEAVAEELTAQTVVLQPVDWPQSIRVQGTLYADEVSAVGARVSGRIREVHVQLGDDVQAGQPLVSLDTEEFQLMVSQAEAQLAQARAAVGLGKDAGQPIAEWNDTLDPENSPPVRQQRALWGEARASLQRASKLLEQGAISEGEFDVVEAEEKVVEAGYAAAINAVEEKLSLIGVRRVELELARQRLRDAVILAPFDGSVQNRLVAPGGYLAAGDSVVTLVRSNPIWFRGQIPERYVAKLAVGLPLQVKIESLAAPVDAVVTRISPTLDLSSRSLSFEARLDNADGQFRSGIFATADLVIDPSSKALSIPISAVSRFAGAEKVWKLTDGIARQVEIHTGVRRGDQVEVIDGLADRDAILADAAVGRVARVVPLTLSDVSQAETGIGSAVPAGGSAPAATLTGKPLDTLVGIQAN